MNVDDLDTLACEERDGTGPEHFRPAWADSDLIRERAEQDALELAAERAAALRRHSTTVMPERRAQLVAAAHRQYPSRPSRPVSVGRLLLVAAGIIAVAAGFSWCMVYLAGVGL